MDPLSLGIGAAVGAVASKVLGGNKPARKKAASKSTGKRKPTAKKKPATKTRKRRTKRC